MVARKGLGKRGSVRMVGVAMKHETKKALMHIVALAVLVAAAIVAGTLDCPL